MPIIQKSDFQECNSGIYEISNPDGEVYIGSSQDVYHRFYNHMSASATRRMKESVDKHGVIGHRVRVVLPLPTWTAENVMRYFEKQVIEQYEKAGRKLINVNIDATQGRNPVRANQYDLDGNYINTFNSIAEAAKSCGLWTGSVHACLRGASTRGGNYRCTKADSKQVAYLKESRIIQSFF